MNHASSRRDFDAKLRQLRPNIQRDTLWICLQRLLKIGETAPLVNAAIADDIDGQKPILEFGADFGDDEGLIDDGPHRDGIIARNENEVGEKRRADQVLAHVIIECYIALGFNW